MDYVWQSLNVGALCGWSAVLGKLCCVGGNNESAWQAVGRLVLGLESLCCVEVGRMLVGDLRGNSTLGVVLHYSRMFVCLKVLSGSATPREPAARAVLYAWAITEVCRYPAYIWKRSDAASLLRCVVPMVTFPLGTAGEALATYDALTGLKGVTKALARAQIFVNLSGFFSAYPPMLKRGLKKLFPQKKKQERGVVFPMADGERSTTVTGKKVWAAVARELGEFELATLILAERDWRNRYSGHIIAIAEAQAAATPAVALQAAQAGLDAIGSSLEYISDKKTTSLAAAVRGYAECESIFETATVHGQQQQAPFNGGLPVDDKLIWGSSLADQLKTWVSTGEMEGDAAAAVQLAASRPDWLQLKGKCFLVFGANSQVGPCRHLLQLGATVIAIGTRKPARWRDLVAYAKTTSGTLIYPVRSSDDAAGVDVLKEAPELLKWLLTVVFAPLTIGFYTYLDGEAHVRVNAVCDVIANEILMVHKEAALHYLGSPATAHLRPREALAAAKRAALKAPRWQRSLFKENSSEVFDGLVLLQGPNYALAKQLQMWRAMVARPHRVVSSSMAPPVRTESMMRVPAVRASLKGAAYFGTSSYSPELASAVMTLLLIAHTSDPQSQHAALPLEHPTQIFAKDGFTGGLWRAPYTPQATGLAAALLGTLKPSF